jgi:hypothetical protein
MRRAALGAGQADVSQTRSASLRTGVEDVVTRFGRTPLTHAYPGGCAVLVAVAFPLHDFNGLSYDGACFG